MRVEEVDGPTPRRTYTVFSDDELSATSARLSRRYKRGDLVDADSLASRDTRELEAEAVAFVVGTAVGLDTADSSRGYIHLYRGDREALSHSLVRIQYTASCIRSAIEPAPA